MSYLKNSNNIIQKLITISIDDEQEEIEKGGDNLLNFLFFMGYLKKVTERAEGTQIYITLKMPDIEVKNIYERKI